MFETLADRRSIRKYRTTPVPKPMVEKILQAGILAPSSKNRQPWKFVVTAGRAKSEALDAMETGLKREAKTPLLPQSAPYLSGAVHTLAIMRQAPVLIFVVNPLGIDFKGTVTPEERIYEICNAQSIGAAIENMTLAATELGLGSLWICDTYFAHEELNAWLNLPGQLAAAIAVGYPDEAPSARPRKEMAEAVQWLDWPEEA